MSGAEATGKERSEVIDLDPLVGCTSYAYTEARTGIGRLLSIRHPSEMRGEPIDELKDLLRTRVLDIDASWPGKEKTVSHGGYGAYTRYDIEQHKYAGGGCGFTELIEVKNPPDDRCGIIIYEGGAHGHRFFSEWDDLDVARGVWERTWGSHNNRSTYPEEAGCRRVVECGALTPWFYAVGEEALIGDYAVPSGFQDDPVYRLGQRFVVWPTYGEDMPMVKTCMGTRCYEKKNEGDWHRRSSGKRIVRIVYWDDGSVYEEDPIGGRTGKESPRPLDDSEEWVVDAVRQFRELLAGRTREFNIELMDGHRFRGKLYQPKGTSKCAAGDYWVEVEVEGAKEIKKGWVSGFVPTKEYPDIVQYVRGRLETDGKKILKITIGRSRNTREGKKWRGVFYAAEDQKEES